MNEKEDFFFMVYVEGEHTPAYKHSDLTSAETERLMFFALSSLLK